MSVKADGTIFPTTRLTLLAGLGNPVSKAWDDFFSVYATVIFRMARRGGLGEEAAEEIVAIVMRNFFSSVTQGFHFDPKRGQFRKYLRTIANRSIRQMLRQEHARTKGQTKIPLETISDFIEAPEAAWTASERQERWQVCLGRLCESSVVSPRDFEAFEALVLKGEPVATVAKRFGVTTNRLYGIKHSIILRLRKIREQLDAELGDV